MQYLRNAKDAIISRAKKNKKHEDLIHSIQNKEVEGYRFNKDDVVDPNQKTRRRTTLKMRAERYYEKVKKGLEKLKKKINSSGFSTPSYGFKIASFCNYIFWLLVGILFTIAFLYQMFGPGQLLTPKCPLVLGVRECNQPFGTCVNSRCVCVPTFSGEDCTVTLGLGYNITTNTECFGRGRVAPYFDIPPFCLGQWDNATCVSYVTTVRQKLSRLGDNINLFPAAVTIPNCWCDAGYSGQKCLETYCNTDENGLICGEHGNKSVGISVNVSSPANTGCQCTSQVNMVRPVNYLVTFPLSIQLLIRDNLYYNELYRSDTCGRFLNITSGANWYIVRYADKSNFQCFCEYGWSGPVCNDNQCLIDPITKQICSGHGHPLFGQGVLRNTSYNISPVSGKLCNIECVNDNYIPCSATSKCVWKQNIQNLLFKQSAYCANPTICPEETPVRCSTAECVTIPQNTVFGLVGGGSTNCGSGFTYGSIDPDRMYIPINQWKCMNITNEDTFTQCFLNTTEINGVLGYRNSTTASIGGGVYLNASYEYVFDFGSPLMYWEMIHNSTAGFIITTWDGQSTTVTESGYVSGSFTYNYLEQGNWLTVESGQLGDPATDTYLTYQVDSEQYSVYPMRTFNYSGAETIPSNFSTIRLINSVKNLIFVIRVTSTQLDLITYDPNRIAVDPDFLTNGLIVRQPETLNFSVTPLYYSPILGNLVPTAQCLSNPSVCSWYLDQNENQLRNLESTLYICNSSSTLFVQSIPCTSGFSAYIGNFSSVVYSWRTALIGTPVVPISSINETFNLLERNYTDRSTWPFTITWLPTSLVLDLQVNFTGEYIVSVENPSFLTRNRITYACACSPIIADTNRSTLNELWYGENQLRAVNFNELLIGDHLLVGTYANGEKELFRTRVKDIDRDAELITVQDTQTNTTFTTYAANARIISSREVIRGYSDSNLLLTPLRCPDGTATSFTSYLTDIPVSCNCTINSPIADCFCNDLTPANWTCQCNFNVTLCQCDEPGGANFAYTLADTLLTLETTGCSLLIYTPTLEELMNSTVTIYPEETTGVVSFIYSYEQVITHLVIKTSGSSCNYSEFEIYGTSDLFSNITIPFTYVQPNIFSSPSPCEYWLTLYVPDDPAFNNLTIVSNTTITWATLLFSTAGFSLFQLESSAPVFTASSNSIQAKNVNLLNSSYWQSSGLFHDIPAYIKVNLGYKYYIDYVWVAFYQGGQINLDTYPNNFTIPIIVWLQAGYDYKGVERWVTLGNFSVYVEEGGWNNQYMFLNISTAYDRFRLIATGGQFGVRQWQLFTNQVTLCELDGEIQTDTVLVVDFNTTEGLQTLSDQLQSIDYFFEHVDPSQGCVAINNCTLPYLSGSDVLKNYSLDGFCQDEIAVGASLGINYTLEAESETLVDYSSSWNYILFTDYISELGLATVQFGIFDTLFLNEEEQISFYYNQFLPFGNLSAEINSTTVLTVIFYLNPNTLAVQQSLEAVSYLKSLQVTTYIENTYTFNVVQYQKVWGDLVATGQACRAGTDARDCGSNTRNIPVFANTDCALNYSQARLLLDMQSGFVTNRTYYMQNLTQLTNNYTAYFQNIRLTRKVTLIHLDYCHHQICPVNKPYKCINGECVRYPEYCDNRYFCPGNGCYQLAAPNGGLSSTFRCLCERTYGGNRCQFREAKPATPFNYRGVSAAQEITSGGPPRLRIHPATGFTDATILSFQAADAITIQRVALLNIRPTGNCAPRSAADVYRYICVTPIDAPFGVAFHYAWTMTQFSDNLTPLEKVIYTSCPPARKGQYGEYYTVYDDLEEENAYSGAAIKWRTYIVNGQEVTYPWQNAFCCYNDFPYRGPNGRCYPGPAEATKDNVVHPVCNGQGTPMADGTCECFPGHRTVAIQGVVTAEIETPYYVLNGVSDPSVWYYTLKGMLYGHLYCVARDCTQEGACDIPRACWPGTPSLNFTDAQIQCPVSSGLQTRCAPSLDACNNGVNITYPLICSGNGILRYKDFTGEPYCVCGRPVSSELNITEVSQVTQLVPEGWGDIYCNKYQAPNIPFSWSTRNELLNEPYKSLTTGVTLPGMWVSGLQVLGPDPDDPLFRVCCAGYERAEYCPFIPCRDGSNVVCKLSIECADPLVYFCNNHGLARADGTCLCNKNVYNSEGYTYDKSQYSRPNCYRYIKCAAGCNTIDPCLEPDQWRHPLPYDIALEQQWFTAGLSAQGEYVNATKIAQVSAAGDAYNSQIYAAAAAIAVEVRDEIVAMSACRCEYPTDTQYEKCCMNAGSVPDYEANYKFANQIWGSFNGYPNLTDLSLESMIGNGNYEFRNGDVLNFTLQYNVSMTLSAIRIWAYATVTSGITFSFFDGSTNQFICQNGTYTPPIGTNILGWSLFSIDGQPALQCEPTYQCFVYALQDPTGYLANCINDPTSSICLFWQEETCVASSNNIYWPITSQDVFYGCDRGSGDNICTCCTRSLTSFQQIQSGTIKMTITAPPTAIIYIGQIRYLSYANKAYQSPTGLINNLIARTPNHPEYGECQDFTYYLGSLGPDNTYYTPIDYTKGYKQQPVDFNTSKYICNNTGGYLAVTNTLFTTQTGDATSLYKSLSYACQQLRVRNATSNNADPVCWVNAKDTYYDTKFIGRPELFTTSCTDYGCFTLPQTSNEKIAFSFSTYPLSPEADSKYRVATFAPTQVNAINALFPQTFAPDASPDNIGRPLNLYYPGTFAECRIVITTYGDSISFTYKLGQTGFHEFPFAFEANPSNYKNLYKVKGYGWRFSIPDIVTSLSSQPWLEIYIEDRSGLPCAGIVFYSSGYCERIATVNDYAAQGDRVTPNGQSSFPFGDIPLAGKQKLGGSTLYNYITFGGKATGTCISFFPLWNILYGQVAENRYFGVQRYVVSTRQTRTTTIGTYGRDWLPGIESYPFAPVFLKLTPIATIRFRTQYDDTITTNSYFPDYTSSTVPRYFTGSLNDQSLVDFFTIVKDASALISNCNFCMKQLTGNFVWDQLRYTTGTWANILQPPVYQYRRLFIFNPTLTSAQVRYVLLNTTTQGGAQTLGTYSHQLTFIQSIANARSSASRRVSTVYNWTLDSCVVVGSMNALGAITAPCENGEANNYICQYDYTKYCTQPGAQCPKCGPNTRTNSLPAPGVTCQDEHPLANATLYPKQHEIYSYWLQNLLDVYIDKFSPLPTFDPYENVSIIWGFQEAWYAFMNKYSTQAGQLGPTVSQSELNWINLCVECIWPITCPTQSSVLTNYLPQNYCAKKIEQCPLSVSAGDNVPMIDTARPPILLPVDADQAYTDTTCGTIIYLKQYVLVDDTGGSQSETLLYSVILLLTSTYVQFQYIPGIDPIWFNTGKSPSRYIFNWNTPTQISGRILILGCDNCDVILEFSIHPTSPFYEYPPLTSIKQNITILPGVLTSYSVNFTVTQADTQTYTVNGNVLPIFVFRGVGYKFYGLENGATVTLYNPVLTNDQSRQTCITRTPPTWYESKNKIKSTAPINYCILDDNDKRLNPTKDFGQCGCSFGLAGSDCKLPGVLSLQSVNGEPATCGGYGDGGTLTQGFDGEFYTTRTGLDAGGYVVPSVALPGVVDPGILQRNRGIGECKTYNLATFARTIQTGNIWDFESIFIDAAPQEGAGLFIAVPNPLNEWITYDTLISSCLNEAARLIYYFDPDELNQLLRTYYASVPIFFGILQSDVTVSNWPWEDSNIENTYFIYNEEGRYIALTGDLTNCGVGQSNYDTCLTANFNNWAFTGTASTSSCLIDGNTIQTCSPGSTGYITWSASGPFYVYVYVVGSTDTSYIDSYPSTGGCGTGTVVGGVDTYFICRCPSKQLSFAAGTAKEIQIFEYGDTSRSSAYIFYS